MGPAALGSYTSIVIPSPLVELVDVSVRLGSSDVLRNLSLVVNSTDVVGIEGPNGAGKSTLLRVCATLMDQREGGGTIFGAKLGTAAARAVRPRIGLLAHEPALYPELTLKENLAFYAKLGNRNPARVDELLEGVGIAGAADRRTDEASQGMQRRVDIARILLIEPELILLDEPHAGLDAAAEKLIAAVVSDVTARGGAAIIVSHDTSRLNAIATQSFRLERGALV